MTKSVSSRRHKNGFSLLELLVVLALVAILLGFALPSYQKHLHTTHRSAARNTLLMLAQKLEQHYSLEHSYQMDLTTHIPHSTRYTFSLRPDSNQEQFVLMASPVGEQAQDECGILLLNERLLRGAGGVLDNRAALTRRCWQ